MFFVQLFFAHIIFWIYFITKKKKEGIFNVLTIFKSTVLCSCDKLF